MTLRCRCGGVRLYANLKINIADADVTDDVPSLLEIVRQLSTVMCMTLLGVMMMNEPKCRILNNL